MFTVLISGNIQNNKRAAFFEHLRLISSRHAYYPIEVSFSDATQPLENPSPIDQEVFQGARLFYQSMNCNYAFYINCIPETERKIKYSCSEISDDLSGFFSRPGNKSNFLDFFSNFMNNFSFTSEESLFLSFAEEWEVDQKIRLTQASHQEVVDYFSKNNGWGLWLYDLENHQYDNSGYYIPLVFQIKV